MLFGLIDTYGTRERGRQARAAYAAEERWKLRVREVEAQEELVKATAAVAREMARDRPNA